MANSAITGISTGAATQAEQETGTATNVYVSPGRQHYHESAAKFWVQFTSVTTTAILSSYNVTSIADNGTGDTTVTIATDFSSAAFCTAGMSNKTSDSAAGSTKVSLFDTSPKTAGTVRVQTTYSGGSPADTDLEDTNIIGFGDQ